MRIVGASFDPPSSTKPWVEKEHYPFEVWTDSQRTLATALGCEGMMGFPARKSYLIGADGTVLLQYGSVSVGSHPEDVLADAQRLFGKK